MRIFFLNVPGNKYARMYSLLLKASITGKKLRISWSGFTVSCRTSPLSVGFYSRSRSCALTVVTFQSWLIQDSGCAWSPDLGNQTQTLPSSAVHSSPAKCWRCSVFILFLCSVSQRLTPLTAQTRFLPDIFSHSVKTKRFRKCQQDLTPLLMVNLHFAPQSSQHMRNFWGLTNVSWVCNMDFSKKMWLNMRISVLGFIHVSFIVDSCCFLYWKEIGTGML